MNILMTGKINVPDIHPIFGGAIEDLGEKAHWWAPDIETLTSDRVIWAYQFGPEFTLYAHAITSTDKRWKKNIVKMAKRCQFFG